jgi:LAO/AO transport system kinase
MSNPGMISHSELYKMIRRGDRIALGRAITLVESRKPDHISEANALLDDFVRDANAKTAMRIAVSGAPGVGKSTFIEAVSSQILGAGHKLAVLAIDPSSQRSGGSILGDKTRMHSLSGHPNAFVRPSPAGLHLGGVAERTRESILLCEAAGFDVIIVETVGVGQSETQVRTMVDMLLLLIAPGGGDEVQGIKRGILELADIVVVHKADGDMEKRARETMGQYTQALRVLFAAGQLPAVLSCSSLQGTNVPEVWQALKQKFKEMSSEALEAMRGEQQRSWFIERVRQDILESYLGHPQVAETYARMLTQIAQRDVSVRSALTEMQVLAHSVLNQNKS